MFGSLRVEFACAPALATELELANATGIRELAKILGRSAPDVRMVYVKLIARDHCFLCAQVRDARVYTRTAPPTLRPLPRGNHQALRNPPALILSRRAGRLPHQAGRDGAAARHVQVAAAAQEL